MRIDPAFRHELMKYGHEAMSRTLLSTAFMTSGNVSIAEIAQPFVICQTRPLYFPGG